MPDGRRKFIHCIGNVAKVSFVAAPNTKYTGVFKGAENALLRLSNAGKPDFSKTTAEGAKSNFLPGFGFKILRNGLPSANLVAMFGVAGYPSWNFFDEKYPASNHIGSEKGIIIKIG